MPNNQGQFTSADVDQAPSPAKVGKGQFTAADVDQAPQPQAAGGAPAPGTFQQLPYPKGAPKSPWVSAGEGALKSFGVDPTSVEAAADKGGAGGYLAAMKTGLSQAGSAAWRGVTGETANLRKAMGEEKGVPVVGTPFTDVLAVPHIIARGYETLVSGLTAAGQQFHEAIQTKDPNKLADATGQIVSIYGQARLFEQADTAWKYGAKQQLQNTISQVRAEGARHFAEISARDAVDNAQNQVAGTHNVTGYINDLNNAIQQRATAPSVRLSGTMEAYKTLGDMMNRPGPNQGNPLLNFSEFMKARSRIGEELGKARRMDKAEGLGMAKSVDSQLLSELYGKMSTEGQARAGQLGAASSWKAGNGRFSELHNILEQTPIGDALRSDTGAQFFHALDSPEYGSQIRGVLKDWQKYGLDENFQNLLKETRNLRMTASQAGGGNMRMQQRLGVVGLAAMAQVPRPFLTTYAALMVKNALINTISDASARASGKLDEMAGIQGPSQGGPTPVAGQRTPFQQAMYGAGRVVGGFKGEGEEPQTTPFSKAQQVKSAKQSKWEGYE